MDAYGAVLNSYTGQHSIDEAEPDRPWAVHLADTAGGFHLIAFDLDAKTPTAADAAARDADVLAGLLTDAGIDHVICASGPSGGRHVWLALAEPAPAPLVADLAAAVRRLCPSLDIAPLANPRTGSVRPPGAPHRNGGHSTVLAGDIDSLHRPTVRPDQLHQLATTLNTLTAHEPHHNTQQDTPLPVDETGHVYLPGARRPLPTVSAAALNDQTAAAGDASAVTWRVLIGAAGARWRHADLTALVATAAGLEHLRTSRSPGGGRQPRPAQGPSSTAAVLARQWHRAVLHVATSPRQVGEDPTFDARAGAIAAHVRQLQDRADATAGRWTRGGGPADRRILDVLCLLALQALTADLEADNRRLALLAGVGRETARTALLRLAADGWIAHAQASEGPHGAHWTIDPQPTIHSSTDLDRSQAVPRPAGAGTGERSDLLTVLAARTADAAHDLFTLAPGLGHHAGNLYARTSTTSLPLHDLAHATGATAHHTARTLDQLVDLGLLIHDAHGWRRTSRDRRHAIATHLGIDGRLADRARRYAVERAVWAWWQIEHTWMTARGRKPRKRRPTLAQPALALGQPWDLYPKYPRTADHRADHRAATTAVTNGQLDHLELIPANTEAAA